MTENARPRIVCLCGSTRFKEQFEAAEHTEGLAGNIVLTVVCFGHRGDLPPEACTEGNPTKLALDGLHLRKIEMADEILVINVGGHIGKSTKREIAHARALGKPIRYLEPDAVTSVAASEPPRPDALVSKLSKVAVRALPNAALVCEADGLNIGDIRALMRRLADGDGWARAALAYSSELASFGAKKAGPVALESLDGLQCECAEDVSASNCPRCSAVARNKGREDPLGSLRAHLQRSGPNEQTKAAFDVFESLLGMRRPVVDWTEKDGRSNSSERYLDIVATVQSLIGNAGHDLIHGRLETVASLIVSQLAHRHGLSPADAVVSALGASDTPRVATVSVEDLADMLDDSFEEIGALGAKSIAEFVLDALKPLNVREVPTLAASPDDIRALGWTVAVHNDYRLGGAPHTFWGFSRGTSYVKGEGRTDAEALDAVRAALASPVVEQKDSGASAAPVENERPYEGKPHDGQPREGSHGFTAEAPEQPNEPWCYEAPGDEEIGKIHDVEGLDGERFRAPFEGFDPMFAIAIWNHPSARLQMGPPETVSIAGPRATVRAWRRAQKAQQSEAGARRHVEAKLARLGARLAQVELRLGIVEDPASKTPGERMVERLK